MSATISDIRVNGIDPSTTTVYSGISPTISWNFIEDVESTTQAGFEIRIGSSSNNLGHNSFVGDKTKYTSDSSVPYFEYPYNNLTRSSTFYCQIKVWDNEYSGVSNQHISDWYTFSFRINSLPVIKSASIYPVDPNSSDNLRLSYIYEDDDFHEETGSVIKWYKHNILQPQFDNLLEIESKYIDVGDSWTARINPSDGLEYGATYITQAVSIIAADIHITDAEILPEDANIDDILKIEYTIPDDPYLDLSNSETTYEWYVNGVKTDKTEQLVRLDLEKNDEVYSKIIIKENNNTVAQATSPTITISDSEWKLFDLKVGGMKEPIGLTELRPNIEWKKHKTKSLANDTPTYLRILITKTPSRDSFTFDSGYIEYQKDSYQFSSDVLERGNRFFVHVGAGDSVPFTNYITTEIITNGSSWEENVDNAVGWTIEFRAKIGNQTGDRQGLLIHDGKYFGAMFFATEETSVGDTKKPSSRITFSSGRIETYEIIEPSGDQSFSSFQTYRVTGYGTNIRVFLNNKKVLSLDNILTIPSLLKQIDFGDVRLSSEHKASSPGTWKFFRYSTDGAYDIDSDVFVSNDFDFYSVGKLPGGSIDCMIDDAFSVNEITEEYRKYFPSSFLLSWKPESGSSKLISYNENGEEETLPVATKNYSPITAIKLDNNLNKYISSSNGVTVLYGSKHDPDYFFDTTGTFTIPPSDFDRITNFSKEALEHVMPQVANTIVIDTTHTAVGYEGDPYRYTGGICYLSQRTHGHAWFDKVDNSKGWQTEFTMSVGSVEQSIENDTDLNKEGIGIYVNDGNRQEIIIFTRDRITFLFANVYVDINTGISRTYRIVGKDDNLLLYQRYASSSVGTEQLVIDGTGLFVTPASVAGNSRKPKIAVDSAGNFHCVWHDDGNRNSTILYSKLDGNSWSHPEVVIEGNPFAIKNPDIAIDGEDKIYVVYEDVSFDSQEISVSIKDNLGWNPKIRITNSKGKKTSPCICIDHLDNVHIVWQDERNGKPEIYWAYRNKQTEAWQSSAQFGEDQNIVFQNPNDSNMSDNAMSFKNPSACYVYPKVYIAFEGDFGDGTSGIFTGNYDTLNKNWISSGYPQYTAGNETSTTLGTSRLVSDTGRRCVNPDISGFNNSVVVVWEDQTEPVSQIWGNSFFVSTGEEYSGVTKITNRLSDCKNPSVGFISSIERAIIAYESQDFVSESGSYDFSNDTSPNVETSQIYADRYISAAGVFAGSGTGYSDELIMIENEKISKHPALPKISPSVQTKLVYDFIRVLSEEEILKREEHPLFWMIGDADLYFNSTITDTSIDTNGIGILSSPYTKEFAIGDIDDTVGSRVYIQNISMYFGYNAKPLSVLNINTNTVQGWPDNRVYDLFTDTYGNILAATHSGLAYYKISNGEVKLFSLDKDNPDKTDFIVTAIDYSKNGVWFVGTSSFVSYSYDGGQTWSKIDIVNTRCITTDINGSAVIGTSSGIYVVPLNYGDQTVESPIFINKLTNTDGSLSDDSVKSIKVDESNIIWAGTESGIIRIENYVNKTLLNIKNGMRSSHVNDISIVNKATRYIATATGIEKMTGFSFENISTLNTEIKSDNILSLNYVADTKGLWFSAEEKLYELVLRDEQKEETQNELIEYDTELVLTSDNDRYTNYILGLNELVGDDIEVNEESVEVRINKNPIEFGYSVNKNLEAIVFDVSLLQNDQVEVLISNKFKTFKDFSQISKEEEILGIKKTSITAITKTPANQLLLLSGEDNNQLMAYAGLSNMPFVLIVLDRDKPNAALQTINQLTRTSFKFRVLSSDETSGVTDMIVSNYENFTSDGTTLLSYEPIQTYVNHDIGEQLNETIEEFNIPDTAVIDAVTYPVGTGKLLATMKPSGQNSTFVYAITTKPIIIFRMDPFKEEWESIATLDNANPNMEIHSVTNVNETLFLTTGTTGGTGRVYICSNGTDFGLIGVADQHIYCSVADSDGGYIYFGTNSGNIYRYSYGIVGEGAKFEKKYSDIGDKVFGLEYNENKLYVVTENYGTDGSGFEIDLTTDTVLTMFPKSIPVLNDIRKINDLYIVSNNTHEVWRSKLEEPLDFVKSYSSSTNNDLKLYKIPTEVLTEKLEGSS
jgi:hypothetical protein